MATPPEPAPVITSGGFLARLPNRATSVFAFVIAFTYIGFGALCHDYGFSMGWAMLSTALQWAGPAQVILVTGLGAGTALIETAVAVGLSSVRLLPIVVALLPLVRASTRGPGSSSYRCISWRSASGSRRCAHAPRLPRDHRIAFCNGVGVTLLAIGVVFTAVGYTMQALLPAMFGAAAMFITPISFLISAARNARLLLEKAGARRWASSSVRCWRSARSIRPAVDRHHRRHAGLWRASGAAPRKAAS